jgi:RNA polymerase sigma-70 factor (ECF subfamily)
MSHNPDRELRFRAWLEAHRNIMMKVTRSYARTPTEAADLDQELRLQRWNSLAGYSGQAKESTWIYRVCLNTALSWRRSAGRREAKTERGVDLCQIAGSAASPAESADQRELLEQLYCAIHRIDEFSRALLLLLLEGLFYREIAEITGLSETNVGVALTRARKRLATLMKGVTDELG